MSNQEDLILMYLTQSLILLKLGMTDKSLLKVGMPSDGESNVTNLNAIRQRILTSHRLLQNSVIY